MNEKDHPKGLFNAISDYFYFKAISTERELSFSQKYFSPRA